MSEKKYDIFIDGKYYLTSTNDNLRANFNLLINDIPSDFAYKNRVVIEIKRRELTDEEIKEKIKELENESNVSFNIIANIINKNKEEIKNV